MADPQAAPSLIPLPPGVAPFPAPPAAVSAGPAAPAESVPVEIKAIEQAFTAAGSQRFLDLSGRFTFDDRAQIAKGVSDLAGKTNAKVYVLALPGKTDVNAFATIHADLKLQPRDVLLIFSAEKRHLHSQAIPKTVGSEILKETNKDFYKSQTVGVLKMFDAIAARLTSAAPSTTATVAPPSAAPNAARSKTMIPAEYVFLAIAVALIAWALFRTSKKPTAKKHARTTPKS